MTKSTNSSAPDKDYENGRADKGAAFRASITCQQAREKLPSETCKTTFDEKIAIRPKKGHGSNKAFYTNPWSAYAASRGTTGTEIYLDQGLWRLIRFKGCWFLAKHAGANNDFEFWHLSDPPSFGAALADAKNTTNPPVTLPAQPLLTQPTQLPSMTLNNATTTVLMPAKEAVVPDSWEDLAD